MFTHDSYDALVVGARCAGAATAMLMARRGMRVLVIDRAGYGTDTVSTHALMRGAVLQLHRWGVLPRLQQLATPAVHETIFHYGRETVPVTIRPSHGVTALYAPRRNLLDAALVDAARDAGAEVRHGYTLTDFLRRPDGHVCGASIADSAGTTVPVWADLVVGADGIGSSVARLVRADTLLQGRNATALIFGYFPGIDLTGYHWWFLPGLGAGAIPTNHGHHCIFVALPPERLRNDRTGSFHAALHAADPALADQVAGLADGPLRVFGGRKGSLRQAYGPGWALVGDAGYFRDPLTAHGITDALRDAELLADAAATGTLAGFAAYAATRDALSLPLFEASDAIAGLDWDFDQIKVLHQTLNHAMKREVEHLLTLQDTNPIRIMEDVS